MIDERLITQNPLGGVNEELDCQTKDLSFFFLIPGEILYLFNLTPTLTFPAAL